MKPLGSSAVASMPAVGGKNCAGSGSTDKNKASASRGIPTRWCGDRLWPQRLTPRIVVRKVHTIGIASNRIPTVIARTTPQESRWFLLCKLGGAGLTELDPARIFDHLDAECRLHMSHDPDLSLCARTLGDFFLRTGDPQRARRSLELYLEHPYPGDTDARRAYLELLRH